MALTVSRIGEHTDHALGGRGQFDPVELTNLAGEEWVNAHPWQYLTRRSKTIDTVSGQNYVDLGDDVRNIISMRPTDSLTNSVEWTTTSEIDYLRTSITGSYNGYWAADAYRKDATTGDLHQIAELWPTPSQSETGFFTLRYNSGWTRVSQDGDTVDVPDWLQPVFLRWCRHYAEGLEDADLGSIEQRLEMFQASASFRAALDRDGAMAGNIGEVEGGAASPVRRVHGRTYVIGTVNGPGA